ncbi:unnamed protein product [Xylocopa violacea]|uniref:Uncharacterized protein n=1 Tax=Xylocopa violacea TaxID=135666 RepID=A0ABP1PEZ2_XYLVO
MCVAEGCKTGRSRVSSSSSPSSPSSLSSSWSGSSCSCLVCREWRFSRLRCALVLPWISGQARSAAAGTTSPAALGDDHLQEQWGKEVPEAVASPEA